MIWRYVNILSLDVSIGAMVGCLFFARIFGISVLPQGVVSLGLIVWIIYTVDHLLDAKKSQGPPSTERHRFHKEHARLLLILVIVVGVLVAFEAFFVRKAVLLAGIGIAALVAGYLLVQSQLKYGKELVGATLYASGVLAAPWSLLGRPLSSGEWGLVALFTSTAFINLLLFSLFDKEADQKDNHTSFATSFGENTTRAVVGITFSLSAILAVLLVMWGNVQLTYILVIAVMNGILLLIFCFRDYFGIDDRFRRLGDSVFLIPAVYLLFPS